MSNCVCIFGLLVLTVHEYMHECFLKPTFIIFVGPGSS